MLLLGFRVFGLNPKRCAKIFSKTGFNQIGPVKASLLESQDGNWLAAASLHSLQCKEPWHGHLLPSKSLFFFLICVSSACRCDENEKQREGGVHRAVGEALAQVLAVFLLRWYKASLLVIIWGLSTLLFFCILFFGSLYPHDVTNKVPFNL